MNRNTGALIASLAAGLFAAACTSNETASRAGTPTTTPDAKKATSTSTKVRCAGINECSGKGACASASNGCAGKNDCKAKGWIEIDGGESACTTKGGTVALGDPMAK